MRPIKMRKKTDENNVLNYINIELIDKELAMVTHSIADNLPVDLYEYVYLAIADGELIRIHENDWESFDAYEIVN